MRSKLLALLIVLVALAAAVNAQTTKTPKPKPKPTPAPVSPVEAEYKRLVELAKKLERIHSENATREPNKSFLKKHEKEIVYSEPAAEWYVRSELFWALAEKNKTLPIADDIAHTAAENPLPGECEGWVNCYLYAITARHGRYLANFPTGKYVDSELAAIAEVLDNILEPIVAGSYTGPTEAEDKAEMQKYLDELYAILAKVPSKAKEPVIEKLRRLGEMYFAAKEE